MTNLAASSSSSSALGRFLALRLTSSILGWATVALECTTLGPTLGTGTDAPFAFLLWERAAGSVRVSVGRIGRSDHQGALWEKRARVDAIGARVRRDVGDRGTHLLRRGLYRGDRLREQLLLPVHRHPRRIRGQGAPASGLNCVPRRAHRLFGLARSNRVAFCCRGDTSLLAAVSRSSSDNTSESPRWLG